MNPETVLAELRRATDAAFKLAENLVLSRGDADEWTRLPSRNARCPVSGFSRSKIVRMIQAGAVRGKSVGASRFYSAGDIRNLIAQ